MRLPKVADDILGQFVIGFVALVIIYFIYHLISWVFTTFTIQGFIALLVGSWLLGFAATRLVENKDELSH
jgi:hypothetical protein